MEDFDSLHPAPAASCTTIGATEASLIATDVADDASGASIPAGASVDSFLSPVPGLNAFEVYWDTKLSSYKMNNPLVYVQGKEVSVADADEISTGTYYCNITEGDNGTWTAKVENKQGTTAAASIKICEISKDDMTQYHVGAIVCDVIGSKLEIKNKDDSSKSIILDASGEAPKITIKDNLKSVEIDTSKLIDTDSTMELKTISWKKSSSYAGETTDSSETAKILASKDIDLTSLANSGVTSIMLNSSSEKHTGDVIIKPIENCGILLLNNSGTLALDISGRLDDDGSFGVHNVTLSGISTAIARVFANTDFEIAQKKIAAGDGISVADDGETVTISATGASSTEAFTGTRTVLADVDFSSPYLRKRFYTETWENGVLKSSTLGAWQNYHTSVEETV